MGRILSILKAMFRLDIEKGIFSLIVIGIIAVLFTGQFTILIPIVALVVILFLIRKLLSKY